MRKRWTPKEEITPELLTFREKRKWAVNLRRYVIEGSKCPYYAPFFGLDIKSFREWIALQFDEDSSWETFGSAWQFDHIVPVNYFDFNNEEDMRLCWNFTNIRVSSSNDSGSRVDLLAAKGYFSKLFRHTGLSVCGNMVTKLEEIEASQLQSMELGEGFIKERMPELETIAALTAPEMDKLNGGLTLAEIEKERAFLKKFK